MAKSRVSLPPLAVAFVAGLVALQTTQNLLACMAGLTLLVLLFAYDQQGIRTGWQSLAFALVCGLALLLASLYPLTVLLAGYGFVSKFEFPPLVWIVGSFAFWIMDRARMGPRQAANFPGYSQPSVPQAVPSIYSSYSSVASNPIAPQPEPVVQSGPVPEAAPVATAVPPPPIVTGQGKEVSIYINLLGEGMNVLRSVRAEHLGRDYYIIVEEMPPGENWEYVTGQVVRCRKKNLSSGKGLVAYEEAPRAQ